MQDAVQLRENSKHTSDITLRWQESEWHGILRSAYRKVSDLAEALAIEQIPDEWDTSPDWPLFVPEPYFRRIKSQTASDPLLRQIVPLKSERANVSGYGVDPLREAKAVLDTGLIQKYANRSLVIAVSECPIHCRYCFRCHFAYEAHRRIDWSAIRNRLASDATVAEVILSGGDPLLLSDEQIAEILDVLGSIESLSTVRIHTRFPVVLPQRVTAGLCEIFANFQKKLVVVIHSNHPNEFDEDVGKAFSELRSSIDFLLNQSVLLRGVNDDVLTLAKLSEVLMQNGVLPYYLHVLDRVTGTAHFNISSSRALEIYDALRARLPGYLVPRLVKEEPGEKAKTLIT